MRPRRNIHATHCRTLSALALALAACAAATGAQAERAAGGAPETPAFDVRISGNQSLERRQLMDAMSHVLERAGTIGLSPARADDAAFFTELHYRRQGFPRALVRWRIDGGSLLIEVEEGPRFALGELRLRGLDSEAARERAREFLLAPTRQRFSRLRTSLPFIRDDLETGRSKLENHYRGEGYIHAEVEIVTSGRDERQLVASPLLRIARGSRYWLGEFTLAGTPPDGMTGGVRQRLAATLDQPYSAYALEQVESALLDLYRGHGHFTAEVEVVGHPRRARARRIPLTAQVEPGPVFTLRAIDLSGAEPATRGFLARRLRPLSGRRYNERELRAATREILESGVVQNLAIHEQTGSHGDMTLAVSASEARTKSLALFTGFESFYGPLAAVSYRDSDLLNSATSLTTRLEISARSLTGSVRHRDPWIFGGGHEFVVEGLTDRVRFDGYQRTRYGVEATLSREVSEHLTASVSLELSHNRIDELDIPPALAGPRDYLLGGVSGAVVHDRRNDALNPTAGSLLALRGRALASGGGQFSYLGASARYSRYIPLGEWVLALGARGSLIVPGGDAADIPIDERLFTGGADSVRSFDYRELGPLARGNPLGGLTRAVVNAELLIPLADQLYLSLFADAGALGRRPARLASDDFRFALGGGLHYMLPIGPLRVEYGWNPGRRADESLGALHIAFGFAF